MLVNSKILKKFLPLVAGPILRRIGTIAAVYLASQGVGPDKVEQVLAAFAIIGGVAYDLAADWLARKEAKTSGYREAVGTLARVTGANLDAR